MQFVAKCKGMILSVKILGLILVNRCEGLLVNCTEVYSRYPTLDAHHEQTKIKHHQSLITTLPHPTTKYPNVERFIVEKDNSLKLVFGTTTMNVLITSSIRIDKNQPLVIGPSSTNGFSVSKDTIIPIRRSFIKWYGDLRQRGFNDLTNRELYSFDENKVKTLSLADIVLMINKKKCKTNVKVCNIMDEIVRLFDGSSTIDIIGNEQLNRPLTNLVNEISPSLITVNKKNDVQISSAYDEL
ncbi:hypothetical protein AB4K20DRAFT_1972422 [Rhizopus microsporus]|uniref:Uncharacterized protein n=1 Tax=Rhizopus microsporus TaxID=58291 RepID=A0A1X0RRL5_RHIZD|nr:hypothetical protein BCV71DRAFT_275593 [Rhizopus microsporus]